MYSINEKREIADDSSVKDPRANMYNKILVPLDGTQNDQAVLEHARLMAKNLGASLVLIQLYRVMKDNDPFFQKIQVEVGSMGYRKKEKGEVYLAELERSLNQDGIDVSKEFLLTTDPEAKAIVTYAEDQECDLIALSNRQRTGLGRWFSLSIEEKVKRRSSLPVLLVGKEGRP